MVCKKCVELEIDSFKKVDADRSGLMCKGINRVVCKCGKVYEKIIDSSKLSFQDRCYHGCYER